MKPTTKKITNPLTAAGLMVRYAAPKKAISYGKNVKYPADFDLSKLNDTSEEALYSDLGLGVSVQELTATRSQDGSTGRQHGAASSEYTRRVPHDCHA